MRIQISYIFMDDNSMKITDSGRDLETEEKCLPEVHKVGKNLGLGLYPVHSMWFLAMTWMRTKCLLGIYLFY